MMNDDREIAGKAWTYHDDPKTTAAIVVGAAILGIVLALALNMGGERTKVATNAPGSAAPVTAPPLVPEPPVGSTVEPRT
jgi:hypothetical protein